MLTTFFVMSHAVEVENLAVHYGTTEAVRDVSLQVDFGEIVVMVGPNGAGKTSTTETLLGFRRPTRGSVRVMGLDPVTHHREVVTRVGALLQNGGVWSPMSPAEVLRLTASYYSAPREVEELIDQLSLGHCRRTPWRRLSGGEQQRTRLALALIGRPRLLVLDEPTAAVDPEGHQHIRELVREERERGCAVLLTTHDMVDAENMADRVIVINHGRVRVAGSVDELTQMRVVMIQTSAPLDLARAGAAWGVIVERERDCHYRIPTDDDPGLSARITEELRAQGLELRALRTRASLEERYLEIVADDRSDPS